MNDLSGQKFGRLTVICDSWERTHGSIIWNCRCDCGNITRVNSNALRTANTKSCGCLHKDVARKLGKMRTFFKHGDSRGCEHPEMLGLYITWQSMRSRCSYQRNASYKYYGAKGIGICDEWKDNYSAFKLWAMANGYQEGLTIDRIDHHGNYEPSNCQWLTRSENARKGNLDRRANA